MLRTSLVASLVALVAQQDSGAAAIKLDPALRGKALVNGSATVLAASHQEQAPCQCEPSNPAWVATARTEPACIFIDLGAADGNSFNQFLNNAYGPLQNCPGGRWMAFLVEANPRFDQPLGQAQAKYGQAVHVMGSTAAFACEGSTTFYLDTHNHEHNYWGSSMSPKHVDAQASGHTAVKVRLMNLNRLLAEQTIPSDYVMVKMDIEGAEWDVVPCLAKSSAASLVDRLLMETHPADLSLHGTTPQDMETAKSSLRQRGVDIPEYYSDTL